MSTLLKFIIQNSVDHGFYFFFTKLAMNHQPSLIIQYRHIIFFFPIRLNICINSSYSFHSVWKTKSIFILLGMDVCIFPYKHPCQIGMELFYFISFYLMSYLFDLMWFYHTVQNIIILMEIILGLFVFVVLLLNFDNVIQRQSPVKSIWISVTLWQIHHLNVIKATAN